MAPPLFSKRDPVTGHLLKTEFGPWMMKAFSLLARGKFLRGTAFDVFGYSEERKQERSDIAEYENVLTLLQKDLSDNNYDLAVQVVELAGKMRGYGHVKDRNREKLALQQKNLLAQFSHDRGVSAVKFVEAA
jgi:indolepyruvate ferredoxin oxidoreductase